LRVLVIGNTGPGGHAYYCETLTTSLAEVGEDAELHGTRLLPRPQYTRLKPLWALDRLSRTAWRSGRAWSVIRSRAPDVVHFQLVTPLVDRWWIPLLPRSITKILTVHNVVPHEPGVVSSPRFFRPILESMDALIVHAAANRNQLLEAYPALGPKVEVVPHGIWPPRHRVTALDARELLGIPRDRPVVLFFGQLRRNKGLPTLLGALRHLRRMRPQPLLIIAGALPRGASFDEYREMITRLDVASMVEPRLGFVPDEDVAAYYAAADVLALPYASTFQAQSGVLLEAYGFGVPIVASDVGAIGDSVREDGTGLAFPEGDEPALAAALSKLLQDPTHRAELFAKTQQLMTGKYSWQTVARLTRDVYRRAVQQKSS
jgi:D-inositol-3-phosphate glycosyltransferase